MRWAVSYCAIAVCLSFGTDAFGRALLEAPLQPVWQTNQNDPQTADRKWGDLVLSIGGAHWENLGGLNFATTNDPSAYGRFRSLGISVGASGHFNFASSDTREWQVGLDFGYVWHTGEDGRLPVEIPLSGSTLDPTPISLNGSLDQDLLYWTPSVRVLFGERFKGRPYLKFGAGYYWADVDASVVFVERYQTDISTDGSIGWKIGGGWALPLQEGNLPFTPFIEVEAHFLRLESEPVYASPKGSLRGPLYLFEFGFGF